MLTMMATWWRERSPSGMEERLLFNRRITGLTILWPNLLRCSLGEIWFNRFTQRLRLIEFEARVKMITIIKMSMKMKMT